MTLVLLDEINQTYKYPPTNSPDGSILNYNLATGLLIANGYKDIDDNLIELFNQGKAIIEDGDIRDITTTDEYKAKVALDERVLKVSTLTAKIAELDLKRIRAIAEPTLRDGDSGQTWLEYYTEQIIALRREINVL